MKVLIQHVTWAALLTQLANGDLRNLHSDLHYRRRSDDRNTGLRDPSLPRPGFIISGRPPWKPEERVEGDYPIAAVPNARHATFQSTFTSSPTGNFVHGFVPNIIPGLDPITYFAGSVLPHVSEGGLPNGYLTRSFIPSDNTINSEFTAGVKGDTPSAFRRRGFAPDFYSSRDPALANGGYGKVTPVRRRGGKFDVNRVGRLYPGRFEEMSQTSNINRNVNSVTNADENKFSAQMSFQRRHPSYLPYSPQELLPRDHTALNARPTVHQETFSPDNNIHNDRNSLNSNSPVRFITRNPSLTRNSNPSSFSTVSFSQKPLQSPGDVVFNENNSQRDSSELPRHRPENDAPVLHYPMNLKPEVDLNSENSYPDHIRYVLKYLRNFTPLSYHEEKANSKRLPSENIPAAADSGDRQARETTFQQKSVDTLKSVNNTRDIPFRAFRRT